MYSVRVTIDVRLDDDRRGGDEKLVLDWGVVYVDARTPAEAARWAAAQTPEKIAEQLAAPA